MFHKLCVCTHVCAFVSVRVDRRGPFVLLRAPGAISPSAEVEPG